MNIYSKKTTDKKHQKGFTFLELIISVAIISTILAAIFTLQSFFFNQQQDTLNYFISTDFTNRAVEKMVKEIRNSRIADNGAYLFEVLNNQEIVFYSNIDKDLQVEKLHYYLLDNTLYRSITEPNDFPIEYPPENEKISVIAQNVTNLDNPIFYYYNSDWPQDTDNNPLSTENRLTQTRLIEINLLLETQDHTQDNNFQIKTYAQIRTLKDNL